MAHRPLEDRPAQNGGGHERRHTKKFKDLGGLAKTMPVFAFFLVFSALASVGLPALNGFVGEFLILVGSFATLGWPVILATFGVVLAAVYLLKMVQETIWGPVDDPANADVPDLSLREVVSLVPLAVFMLWIGVAPAAFLEPSRPALEETLSLYQARAAQPAPAVPSLSGAPTLPGEPGEDEAEPAVEELPAVAEREPTTEPIAVAEVSR
jgi:NADH-quinone oxidoreductase subunit M